VDIGVSKQNLDFFYTIIQKKELTIVGSRNALKADFLNTIEAVRCGKLVLEDAVTNVYPFDEAAQAFKDFDEHQGEMLKTMIEF
jgi:threonine dehydrogenase-like Zn-dependent dehydrogenase